MIPARDEALRLPVPLEALTHQSYFAQRVIVVDDGAGHGGVARTRAVRIFLCSWMRTPNQGRGCYDRSPRNTHGWAVSSSSNRSAGGRDGRTRWPRCSTSSFPEELDGSVRGATISPVPVKTLAVEGLWVATMMVGCGLAAVAAADGGWLVAVLFYGIGVIQLGLSSGPRGPLRWPIAALYPVALVGFIVALVWTTVVPRPGR